MTLTAGFPCRLSNWLYGPVAVEAASGRNILIWFVRASGLRLFVYC